LMNFMLWMPFVSGWISVSGSESHTLEVRTGDEITLMCSNLSTRPTQTDWFRVVNRTKPHCISSMYESDGEVPFCDGFQNGKFEMSSNISTVFLKIKQVDLSDTGLYFCGFYINTHTVISTAIYLNVQVRLDVKGESDRIAMLTSVILGSLTGVLLLVIIGLVVKVRNLQTGTFSNLGCDDDVNYASVTIRPKAKRRELEPNVIYASTR
uniref:Ig-like domain-containing protein n=1 Tax=Sparus aurata TaxID=8175 RepID=A0A671XXD3_SPAAU